MNDGDEHQRHGNQHLRARRNRGQHLFGIAERGVEFGQHLRRENGERLVAPVVLPQLIGIGDRFRLHQDRGQAGRFAFMPVLVNRCCGVDMMMVLFMPRLVVIIVGGVFVMVRIRMFGFMVMLRAGRLMVMLVFVVVRLIVMIMAGRLVIMVVGLVRFHAVDFPDRLDRHENGAVPWRAGGVGPAGDGIGEFVMGVAAGFDRAVHRLDRVADRKIDRRADHRLAQMVEIAALGKAGRRVFDQL